MKKKERYLFYFFTGIFLLFLGILTVTKKGFSIEVVLTKDRMESEEHPKVALTFDDGPHTLYTPQLLDGLKEREVKASFFLLGKCIDGNEEIVKRMQEEGHLIGNHTYDHVQLNKISDEKACEQITKTCNRIYEVTGVYTAYVRPPFGEWKKDLDCYVTMLPVFWSIDSLDWTTKDVDKVVKKVVKQAEDGDIILMHDEYASSVEAALRIVDTLQEKGYEFVTVDEFLLE